MDFYSDAFPAENDKKHKRAAPTKHTASKETDQFWRKTPDYTPPTSSLDVPGVRLKTFWNQSQAQLDISEEPDAELLHEQEYELSEVLRLRPQQYFANKRRIFEEKVRMLRENRTFTKTAAQNVTNIDVNKASKLWESFEKVGWFERRWFEQYL